jgi:O-antigen ligase
MEELRLVFIALAVVSAFVLGIVAIRDFVKALAIWVALLPILDGLNTIPGFEQFSAVRVGTLVLTFAWLLVFLNGRIQLPKSSIATSYVWFLIACVGSSLFSRDVAGSMMKLFSYAQPVLFVVLATYAVRTSPKALQSLLRAMVIGLVLVTLYGTLEYILQRNPLADWGIIRVDAPYLQDSRFGMSGRLVSTIGQPVYCSAYLLVGIPVAGYFRSTFVKGQAIRLLILGFMVLSFLVLIFTGTRASYFSVTFMAFLYVLFFQGKIGQRVRRIFYLLAIGMAITLLLPQAFFVFLGNSINFNDPQQPAMTNTLQRVALSGTLFQIFEANPLWGVGPGFVAHAALSGRFLSYEGLAGLENHYLTILAEGGIVGGAAYLIFMIIAFREVIKKMRSVTGQLREFCRMTLIVMSGLFVFAVSCILLTALAMNLVMILLGLTSFVESENIKALSTSN